MSLLKALFGRKPVIDPNNVRSHISVFRDAVISKAQELGSTFEFQAAPEDTNIVYLLRDGEPAGSINMHNGYNDLLTYPEKDSEEGVLAFARIILMNEEDPADVMPKDIVLVLRPEEYVTAARGQTDNILAEPLFGELYKFYMVDTPYALRGLGKDDAAALDDIDIENTALNNLRGNLTKLCADHSLNGISLFYIDDNTSLTSGLILLDAFWGGLDEDYQKDCYFSLPRKDQLFLFDINHPTALDNARRMVAATIKDDFNILSPQIFRRKNGNITLVE